MTPLEPAASNWALPDPAKTPPGAELIGVGAVADTATMLAGYRLGLFAMEVSPGVLGWYSPDPRGVLPFDQLRISRSLQKSRRRYRVTYDQHFSEVVAACASPARHGFWITGGFEVAYASLHASGWAHSVEVWHGPQLVGGLFGVEVGGLFSGESMFHRERDASKVALMALVARLNAAPGPRILDVQWWTPHLGSLGAIKVPRSQYLANLHQVLPIPPAFE